MKPCHAACVARALFGVPVGHWLAIGVLRSCLLWHRLAADLDRQLHHPADTHCRGLPASGFSARSTASLLRFVCF